MGDLIVWDSQVEGIDHLEEFFDYAGYRARDLREPLGGAKDHIQGVIRQQFETEGVARSGGWQQLTEEYEEWKMAHLPNSILRLTNEMMQVVTNDLSWTVTRDYARYEPPSPKAGWHQEGVPNRTTKQGTPNPLPARPILDLDEYDYMAIEDIFYDWLKELFHNSPRADGLFGGRFPAPPSIFA